MAQVPAALTDGVGDEDAGRIREAVKHGEAADLLIQKDGRHMLLHLDPSREPVWIDIEDTLGELENLRATARLMMDTEGMTHLGVWTWDITEPHAVWSPALYDIYGLDPDTHTPTYEDYLTRIHPDDVDRVKAATERAFQKHIPYSHDERIRHTDGTWRWLHTWAEPVLDAQGNLVALHGVCQDVTDRMHALKQVEEGERRYRAIVDHAPMGIAAVDKDGRMHARNPAMRALLASNQLLEELPDAKPLLESPRDTGLTLPCGDKHLDVRVVDASDFLLVLVEDVTARVRAKEQETALREAESRAAQALQDLREASHEIKNPLTPLIIQLELASRDPSHIAKAQAQAKKLQALVQDLLDREHYRSGGLEMEELDASTPVCLAVDTYADVASTQGIALESSVEPCAMKGNAVAIERLAGNLIGNALRHAKSRVRVQLLDGVLRVADDGDGISDAIAPHLFEPFAKGQHGEHGLGLAICADIAKVHGTRIDARNEDGAVFEVRLR